MLLSLRSRRFNFFPLNSQENKIRTMRIVKATKSLFVFPFEGKGNLLRNLPDRMMKHSSFIFSPQCIAMRAKGKLALL